MEKILRGIEHYFQKAQKLGDYLTEHPEISGEEKESCAYLVNFLREEGYEVTTPYANMPHSFLAVDQNSDKRKKAALLCEYDALPEIGHACGHSYSCAISVLAALALRDSFPDLPLRVDLIGTPGEEFVGGKCYMSRDGGFDGYEFVAMMHLYNSDQANFEILASNDRYFTFHGKAAHASAFPEKGLNALNGARLFMDAMDMWRQHITKDCQFHGIITKGGDAPNVLPEEVCLDYYYRAATLEGLWKLNKISEDCARGAALATGTTVEWVQRYPDYGELYWNEYMQEMMEGFFANVGRTVKPSPGPGGSSDIGNVNMKVPVFHPLIDITGNDPECVVHRREFEQRLHTPAAGKALRDGAAILMQLFVKLAQEPKALKKIQEDHAAYRKLKA